MSGNADRLQGWLDRLWWPEAQADPQLAVARSIVAAVRCDRALACHWLLVAADGSWYGPLAAGLASLGDAIDLIRSTFLLDNAVEDALGAARRLAGRLEQSPAWRRPILLALGQALHLSGSFEEARSVLKEAVWLPEPEAERLPAAAALAWLALVEESSDPAGALDHAQAAVGLLDNDGLARQIAAGHACTALGWSLARLGRVGEGQQALGRAADVLSRLRPSVFHVHALALLAMVQHRGGSPAEARELLTEARQELTYLRDGGIAADLVTSAAERIERAPPRDATYGERLSGRELAVLRLLDAQLTQREIASQLFVSVNTVKSHVRAAYRKLGATSRRQAVREAHEQGLL
jgi:LuxR family maltose regulon positive regulatory protein